MSRSIRHRRRVARPGSQTGREFLATAGRLALWAGVGLLLLRGAGDVLGSERLTPTPLGQRTADRPAWPDDAARALAIEFATAYLTRSPGELPADRARRLAGLTSSAIASEPVPRPGERTRRQTVRAASVERALPVDHRRGLVTVAVTLATREGLSTRRVSVPVASDGRGGVLVYDLPSFAPAPARASASPVVGEPLLGSERAAISDVLERFLRAYLAGDTRGLDYLVPPGTRIAAAAGGRLELLDLSSIAAIGSATRGGRVVLVTVSARDASSGTTYLLRYRVRLVRRDRWYVAELNGESRWACTTCVTSSWHDARRRATAPRSPSSPADTNR